MSVGFPIPLLRLLRCTADGGELSVSETAASDRIVNGLVGCLTCGRHYEVVDGILMLLASTTLDDESRLEQDIRDSHAVRDGVDLDWQHSAHDMTEIAPTIEALRLATPDKLLELGCGNGRYTSLLVEQCSTIVAVDFSRSALEALGSRLGADSSVGRVMADVTRLRVSSGVFDSVLSTLVSNLPTRAHREAMYSLASGALKTDGRFVFGTHHHGIRERYLRIPKEGRYPESGIYRYNLTLSECRREPLSRFHSVAARPIQIFLPGLRRLRWPSNYTMSRVLERVPMANRFGALTVCTASRPKDTESR
jgi:SAM-dependent methyltransferase